MQFKDATRYFGRLGLLFPLILIFLIAAESALACPGHKTGVAYRTKAMKTRMVSGMPTTVITYRSPVSRRCADPIVATNGTRYVAVRGSAYNNGARYVAVRNSGKRYVAVRNSDIAYRPKVTRYIAVRNADVDVVPRYVAVRSQPVYVESGTRYVAVRRAAPRVRYVAVSDIDIDAPRYVAVRRSPVYDTGTRYVAVRNVNSDFGRTKYVAVRSAGNGCARPVALRSCLDQVETMSARHVVVKTDHLAGTQEVIVPNSAMTADYIDYPSDNAAAASYVGYTDVGYTNAAYSSANGAAYVMTSEMETPCMRQVAVRTCPDSLSATPISYAPAVIDDDDFEDQAILDVGGTTYVAANDIGNACLSPVAYRAAPVVLDTETVSYVPVDDVDTDTSLSGSGAAYIETNSAVPDSAYIPVAKREVDLENAEVTYIAADDVDDIDTVSYVPVNEISDVDDIALDVDDIDNNTAFRNMNYMPVEDTHVANISYVPVNDVDTTYVADDACPIMVSSVDAEPVYVADNSAVIVEEVGAGAVAVLSSTQRIAKQFGYHDGFEEGLEDALDNDGFEPTDSGDFRKATEGYEDEFGDKDVYRGVYRGSYLEGYRAGFASVAGSV